MRRDDETVQSWAGITLFVIIVIILSSETRLCVSTPATSDPSVLSLSDLSSLKTDNSTLDADLRDPSYWGSVSGAYTSSAVQMIPNTIIGLLDKSAEWRNWGYENIPSPPPWLSSSIVGYMEAQLAPLRGNALAAGNSTLAALMVKAYAASVVGYPIAALDYVSMNGVTAIRTYLQTGKVVAAVCATFPAQLGALYDEAFEPSVPRERRAQYLGNALAVTTFMLVLAGKDGFTPKFRDALSRVGLADAWGTIKPYLSKISGAVSARASAATFSILQTLATKFPKDSVWVTSLTSYRIETMVEVLEEKGFSKQSIEQHIQDLVRVAGDSKSVDDTANYADKVEYQDGGVIKVLVNSNRQLVLYSDQGGRSQFIPASLLEQIPSFNPNTENFLEVHYQELGITIYHYFTGKSDNWVPKLPKGLANTGDVLTISIETLTPERFVSEVPRIYYFNDLNANWVAQDSELSSFSLAGDDLKIQVFQSPDQDGISSFTIDGKAGPLGSSSGITHLNFQITDVFGQTRAMRINYDGYTTPYLGIFSSPDYSPVLLVSSDGVRLKFISSSGGGGTDVTTIYEKQPSVLYDPDAMEAANLEFTVQGAQSTYEIRNVRLVRQLETSMLDGKNAYDLGRLGAEIAYTVGQKEFGLDNLILSEPSQIGADLHTADWKAVMQARMLDLSNTARESRNDYLHSQIVDMIDSLRKNFRNHPTAQTGYVVLSYYDGDSVRVIIVKVAPR